MKRSRTLSRDEEVAFCKRLKRLVDGALAQDPTLTRRLKKDLKWHSLTRIKNRAEGIDKSFYCAITIAKIGRVIQVDWIQLLAEAGYLAEVIALIYVLAQRDRSDGKAASKQPKFAISERQEVAIGCAVATFSLAHEIPKLGSHQWRPYERELMSKYADLDLTREHWRGKRLIDLRLGKARDVLRSGEVDREDAREIASRYVRSWARKMDSDTTRDAEAWYYEQPSKAVEA